MVLGSVPGWAVYFWWYEFSKTRMGVKYEEEINKSLADIFKLMFCGGSAGVVSWCLVYPLDIMNT